jgi:cellulose synthase/poly-beta-1,6-N-acetylglucosamine synthase-like glycosyltransferase
MGKKQYIGKETFPMIWIWICVFFNFIGMLAVFMLIIAEILVIAKDFNNYVDQYGHSYRMYPRAF